MRKKSCVDCLHCKVSAKSTEKEMFCFCFKNKNKTIHQKAYWLTKLVCKKFVDMTEKPMTIRKAKFVRIYKRQPLLRNRAI